MEFRKTTSPPNATGNPDALFFTKTTTGRFDLYAVTSTGDRTTLDRIASEMTAAGTPPATPRYGDMWEETTTDHIFIWTNNGVGNYWIDIS